jgi:hypothetical protein
MKIPSLQSIQELRNSGKMRKRDEIFWEGDKKSYDFWLGCVVDRIVKWQEKNYKK